MKKIFIIAFVLNTQYCFSQNVGIGTATPSEALDVNGNINLTGSIKANGTDGTANQLLGKNNNGSLSWIDMSEFKNFKSFTGASTTVWTVPAGVTKVLLEAWGAGGGGARAGGGGSGGYIIAKMEVTAGNTLSITCGTGGSGSNSAGSTGGSTTVNVTGSNAGLLTADGGSGAFVSTFSTGQVGAGGNSSSSNNTLQYIIYPGEDGTVTTETYSEFQAGFFVTSVVYGNGGNAPFTTNTGAKGGFFVYNTANINSVNRNYRPVNGRMPGGGGAGAAETIAPYGTSGGNGMVLVRW
jgi:hypothetical protein